MDRAIAVDNINVRLRGQVRQQVKDVADGTTVDHHYTPEVLIALGVGNHHGLQSQR